MIYIPHQLGNKLQSYFKKNRLKLHQAFNIIQMIAEEIGDDVKMSR
jgi:hypothetical protein